MNNDIYNNKEHDFDEFFSKLKLPEAESKEDIWAKMEKKLDEKPKGKVVKMTFRKTMLAAAAVVILLAGVISVMRFYTKTMTAKPGQHLAVTLPDHSVVHLNANSSVSWNPLWWNFDRKLKFSGEAFFEVEKGEKFSVVSEHGTTSVLGTKFNIYSRGNDYAVTCISGKVRVELPENNQEVILVKNQKANRNDKGKLVHSENVIAEQVTAWMQNEFVFTSIPLSEVFEEFERQYDVIIHNTEKINTPYTGNFKKTKSVESVLTFVCRSLELEFTKTGTKEYTIVKK